jgi:fumarate hydratase class II
VQNFNAGGERVPLEIIYGMAKPQAGLRVANQRCGLLAPEKTKAIVKAACRRAERRV